MVKQTKAQISTTRSCHNMFGSEIISNVVGTGAENPSVIRVLPGLLTWLGGVSQNWSKYRWRFLRFVYIPECATTTTGHFAMGMTYDLGDGLPSSLPQVVSLDESAVGPVWGGTDGAKLLKAVRTPATGNAIQCTVDVSKLQKSIWRWKSPTALSAMGTVAGNEFCACSLNFINNAPTGAIGHIYIVYDIDLLDPIPAVLQDNQDT